MSSILQHRFNSQLKYFTHNHNRSICIVYSTLIKKKIAVNTKWIKSNRLYDKNIAALNMLHWDLLWCRRFVQSEWVFVMYAQYLEMSKATTMTVYDWQSTNQIFITLNKHFQFVHRTILRCFYCLVRVGNRWGCRFLLK